MTMQKAVLFYLIAVNIGAFVLYGLDKGRAKRREYRIPERTLLLSAVLGGSVGAWCGMVFFRHKTKHRKFRLGIPIIFLLQAVLFFIVRTILPVSLCDLFG